MEHRIERDIFIEAPVAVVWRAVTEPDQVRHWFADEVDLVAQSGQDGSLSFNHDDKEPSSYPFTVQSVDPGRVFSFRWQHPTGGVARAGNSVLVEFSFVPEAGGTRLRVVETGLEDLGWPAEDVAQYVADHSSGWTFFLERLQRFATASATA